MSDFTFADNKYGGRLTAACEAIGAGHLRKAAGIFNELADDLNVEAEATTGLLSEEAAHPGKSVPEAIHELIDQTVQDSMRMLDQSKPGTADTQSCARGAHFYGAPDPESGWRTCSNCGYVYIGR